MKQFLLAAVIFVFVIIAIVIFQNIAQTLEGIWILIYQFDGQTTASLGLLALIGLGFIAGLLSASLFQSILSSKDEEPPGAEF